MGPESWELGAGWCGVVATASFTVARNLNLTPEASTIPALVITGLLAKMGVEKQNQTLP